MIDSQIDALVERRQGQRSAFHRLMPSRVRNILLVSSLYDSYIFEKDGALTDLIFSEYLELELRNVPRIERVSTAQEALWRLESASFDLVITMLRVGSMSLPDFRAAVDEVAPGLPVLLLAYNSRELEVLQSLPRDSGIDRPFVWLGDVRLFLAMIKYVEDSLNVHHDISVAGVQTVILIEDSIRFYSSYLPILYTELMQQARDVMADGLNRIQKLLRMRARPKVLLASSYEDAHSLYQRYRNNLLSVITDAAFPRGGTLDKRAGLAFARMVKQDNPDTPVLIQSSENRNKTIARAIGASFLHKHSPSLLQDLRRFIRDYLGFGSFVFRLPDGHPVGRAADLRTFLETIRHVPPESLTYHASRNHFSTWLVARTEFGLARATRPRKVSDFESPESLRKFLIETVSEHRERVQEGMVADFSSATFDADSPFVRIGKGSLGGKGRGLAFINSLEYSYAIQNHIEGVRISVPPAAVLATDVFDQFMEDNNLQDVAVNAASDEEIAARFLAADLPADVRWPLATFLDRVRYPLAVRSSSLLEDGFLQPFAGVYQTYMIPNNHTEPAVRLRELENAIKLVFASTFYHAAKSYIESTPGRLEEEKMAVIIQQLVARRHEHYAYPDFAGVARSVDFYPMRDIRPEDGVASVALGLGRTVVEGGRCVRFSPGHPERLYQFSSTRDTLANAQVEYLALDLSVPGPVWDVPDGSMHNLARLELEVAEGHGTLKAVGATYSRENDRVYGGIHRPGIRLVTMAGVLQPQGFFPLAETLSLLLKIGQVGLSCPVEIEFAVNLNDPRERPHDFGFLQIRPIFMGAATDRLALDDVDPADAICLTRNVLGSGHFANIHDIVYVPSERFDRARSAETATALGRINADLRAEDRPYVLIGPGRWGSADHWLGIPVAWCDINGVRCIVETQMEDITVSPSQGTHFFQNLTAFGIGYFTVNINGDGSLLDYDWLDAQPAELDTGLVRHLRFDDPLDILIDGHSRLGVILKAGRCLKV